MSRSKWKSGVNEYIGRKPILSPEKKETILANMRKEEQKSIRKPAMLYGFGLTAALVATIFIAFQLQTSDVDLLTSPEDTSGSNSIQTELDAIAKENEALRNEISQIGIDLQIYDLNARRVISLLIKEDFDELKNQYGVDYNASDERIKIGGSEGANFPLEWSEFPMRFVFINQTNDLTEVGYYLYDSTPGEEQKHSLVFGFNEDRTIRYIVNGD